MAPHHLLNFSLTWSFSSASASSSAPEPGVVLLRYDSRSRGSSSLWEGRAELDPDRVVEGDGSLWLRSPDSLDHSGMYVCTFSALHSKHTVQTRLNVSTAPQSESRGHRGSAVHSCAAVTPLWRAFDWSSAKTHCRSLWIKVSAK